MSSNEQSGLGVALILWRRRWLLLVVTALVVAVALPWGLERTGARETLVRIPRIDRAPVASATEITAEVRMAIAPAVGCTPAAAAPFGVEEAGGLAKRIRAIPPDADACELTEFDERLQSKAGVLDTTSSSWLARAIERLEVEILAFQSELRFLREAPAEFVESGDAPAASAAIVISRASAEAVGIVDWARGGRVSGRMARAAVLSPPPRYDANHLGQRPHGVLRAMRDEHEQDRRRQSVWMPDPRELCLGERSDRRRQSRHSYACRQRRSDPRAVGSTRGGTRRKERTRPFVRAVAPRSLCAGGSHARADRLGRRTRRTASPSSSPRLIVSSSVLRKQTPHQHDEELDT